MQPTNNNGSIQIRFTRFGYKYSLTKLGNFHEKDAYSKAVQICIGIENDIKLGRFACKDNDELFKAYHPLTNVASHHESTSKAIDCLYLVIDRLNQSRFRDRNLTQTKIYLERYGKRIKSSDDALKFWQWLQLTSRGNARTINRHLSSLKAICGYFADIPKLKESAIKDEKPFSKDEIKKIIDVIDSDYSHYSSFIKFLFATGCRPNEATALRWENVDFVNKQITICEAISIAKDGSKVSKDTKTGINRIIPMSDKVYTLLNSMRSPILKGFNESLVFPSPNGSIIDTHNFRARVWQPALKDAGVPYRKLYNVRHTFCSHFLNECPDFLKLASITHGSKSGVQTLIKHYAHLVNKVQLPDIW